MNKKVGAVIALVLLVGADQLTKQLAAAYLYPDKIATAIPGFIQFHYAENTGMAFSLLENARWLFVAVTGVACAAILIYLFFFKCRSYWLFWSLVVVAAGGIGKLIDRVLFGYVIDFIEPVFVDFAIFNFADCLINVGAASLIVYLIADLVRESRRSKKEKGAPDA